MTKIILPAVIVGLGFVIRALFVRARHAGRAIGLSEADDEMNAAIFMARETVEAFLRALQSAAANQAGFAVKKAFSVSADSNEHIWLSRVTYDGKLIYGEVANTPEHAKDVRLGDTVLVSPKEISDWKFVQDGKLVGGYSIRVFYRRMTQDEKRQFVQGVGYAVE